MAYGEKTNQVGMIAASHSDPFAFTSDQLPSANPYIDFNYFFAMPRWALAMNSASSAPLHSSWRGSGVLSKIDSG